MEDLFNLVAGFVGWACLMATCWSLYFLFTDGLVPKQGYFDSERPATPFQNRYAGQSHWYRFWTFAIPAIAFTYIVSTTSIHPDTVKAFDRINPMPLRVFLGIWIGGAIGFLVCILPWVLSAIHGWEVLQKGIKQDAEDTKKLVQQIKDYEIGKKA